MAERPKVIIDCDPGHDDAMAIAVAAVHADVLGITAVAGNASLAHTAPNAAIVAELVGLDCPVLSGADRPLVAEPHYATHIHGRTGLDGPEPRTPSQAVEPGAVEFLIETVRANPGVWLVPVGPLTNIALAFRAAPDLVETIAGLSIMGGAAATGNVTPTAEFNVWFDPEAAAEVFDSGARIKMAGLDLTHLLPADDTFLARLRSIESDAGTFFADLVAFYLDRQEEATGRRLAPVHDVCAVLALTHPELIEMESYSVKVETEGRYTRGMTIVDRRPGTSRHDPTAEVGFGIDAPSSLDVLAGAIGAAP